MRFRNIYFDAIGLARAGKSLLAEEILKNSYPKISSEEIVKVIIVGRTVNELLWNMTEKFRDGEITEKEFKERIIEICPELDQIMISHLIANAMYDTK